MRRPDFLLRRVPPSSRRCAPARVRGTAWLAVWLGGFLLPRALFGAEELHVPAWDLVWSDEFTNTAPAGRIASPDARRWTYDLGGNGWGNSELETYTSRTNNVRIVDGQLVIEARKETFKGTDGRTRDYTSARLKTQGLATWTFGRIEARIRVPEGQGLWPAFWMLGANFPSAGWPKCGEIDVMENIGRTPSTVYGTLHGPGFSGGSNVGSTFSLSDGRRFADDFHRFAVEWDSNRIRWLVDNEVYFTATPASLPAGGTWVFTEPQFVILNVAVGGTFPGNPTAATVFPQRMLVDYVRVYARGIFTVPRLTIERRGAVIEARWPGSLPQAQIERQGPASPAWIVHPHAAEMRDGEFVTAVDPGLYRLRWNP